MISHFLLFLNGQFTSFLIANFVNNAFYVVVNFSNGTIHGYQSSSFIVKCNDNKFMSYAEAGLDACSLALLLSITRIRKDVFINRRMLFNGPII